MAFDETLARRVREVLGPRPGISERRMFGGLAFLLDGRMFVGISGSRLMARVGAERYQDALALPHVREMDFTGRPMKGWIMVEPDGIEEDERLHDWIERSKDFVRTLPKK